MSTLTEAAKAEADKVDEEELDDEETVDEPNPDDEPKPGDTPEASGPGTAKFEKAFEREQARHEKRVLELFGDDAASLGVCIHCGGVGFAPQPQSQPHENFRACDVCAGFGKVLTGSRTAEHSTANCPRCGGRGYLERNPSPTPPAAPALLGLEPADEWGTPSWMGDPSLSH